MDFRVLTKEEVELVLQESQLLMGLDSFSKMELVDTKNDNKTIGWLIMGKRSEDKKMVGIAHQQLNRPLIFEKESDANRYLKMVKKLLKEKI